MDKLTPQQEAYCQARVSGLSQRLSYIRAYPTAAKWKDSAVYSKASTLEAEGKIRARIQALYNASAKDVVSSRAKLLIRLEGLADKAYQKINESGNIDQTSANAIIQATRELLPFTEQQQETEHKFAIDFGLLLSPPFLRPHRMIHNSEITDVYCPGGRGSMKSSFASLEVVNHIEMYPDHHGVVLMKHKIDLRDAAYAQMVWAIEAMGLTDDYDFPESTLRIKKKSTGQLIIFRGCDNPKKMKSIKVPFGRIGIVWYEETDMFNGESEIRTVNQSVTRGADDGTEIIRIYTYNPPRTLSNWINQVVQKRRDDHLPVFDSCYTEAPPEWLGKQFIDDAEELKRTNERAYRHEYLGEPGGTGLEVFDNIVFREITDEEIATFDNLKIGQDFGWYPDPWALTISEWRQGKRELLTWAEDGGNKLQPTEQAERIKRLLTWPDIEGTDPVYHYLPVMSDDADPQDIASQRDANVNARAAGKGGLRDASYRFIQSSTWVIDPKRCPNLAREAQNLQYEVSKDGEVLNTIPDGNDHWIDATRYALMPNVARARSAYRK